MLKGLRNQYLQSLSNQGVVEADIAQAAIYRSNTITNDLLQWKSLWQTILQLFFPSLNNVYVDGGTNGEVRFNNVFTADPTHYLVKQTEFLVRSMFPQQYPWLGIGVYDQGGKTIERGKLSTQMLQHLDDVVNVLRYTFKHGGFYDEIRLCLLHYLLLGNACLRVSPSDDEWGLVDFTNVPIHNVGVQRTSKGKVYALSWSETIERWEVIKEYGQQGMALFDQVDPSPPNPERIMMMKQKFGGVTGGATGFTGLPAANMTGSAVGTANNPQKYNAVETVRLLIPNTNHTGIPNAGTLFPEMGYVCYVMTKKTMRLLDVEFYSSIPYGVAVDLRVGSESYGRGMCGRVLPDVATLNRKKYFELVSDRLSATSPIVVEGNGLVKPIGNTLGEFEVIHAKQGTKVLPMFTPDAMFRRTRAIYEDENMTVRRGMEVDNIEPEYKDRMTGTEYTRRQDTSQGQFLPKSTSFYDQAVHPALEAAMSYIYMAGRIGPPPEEMLLSGLKFKIETHSTFSYGQQSEKGQNLARALGPLGDIPKMYPELLDNINFNRVLRSQMSYNEMGHWVNTSDEVRRIREERAAMESGGSGAANVPATQKGYDKGVAKGMENMVTAGGDEGDISFGGLS